MELGFDPDGYWHQTPRIISLAIAGRVQAAENDQRRAAWSAYTTAALHRAKKMPDLKTFIDPPKKKSKPRRAAASVPGWQMMMSTMNRWQAATGQAGD